MIPSDEVVVLRAERLALLQQLGRSGHNRRQLVNKRLMSLTRRIQRLAGAPATGRKAT